MVKRDVVVIGASAGGVEALRALVAGLPADLPAAVLVVLHVPRSAPSALPAILGRSGPLPARHGTDGEPLAHGRIYVAPPDRHMLVLDGHVRLSRGPSENGHRPAIDPLFRSAARAYGPRVAAAILSGSRDDGAAGLAVVVQRGGASIVQEPADALHPSMPRAALATVTPDHLLPAAKMGPLIDEAARVDVAESTGPDPDPLLNAEVAVAESAPITTDTISGRPGEFGCPSCGGALWELDGEPAPRYRCRVGHAWSPESLLDEQTAALEGALWLALRALEEKSALSRRLAREAAERGRLRSAEHHREFHDDALTAGAMIRELIERIGATGPAPESSAPLP